VPDRAQGHQRDGHHADDRDIARSADAHRQQRRQHDDADDSGAGLQAGVNDRQRSGDQEAGG